MCEFKFLELSLRDEAIGMEIVVAMSLMPEDTVNLDITGRLVVP